MLLSSTHSATIGWREKVFFPDFHQAPITAKVDTGAMTSSLHAADLHLIESGGTTLVSFEFQPDPGRSDPPRRVTSEVVDFRMVRSSNGREETRPVVRAGVAIGDDRFEIDLTLTCRARMDYRMLLGRRVLADRFVVDAGRSFVLSDP
jgi:hypothetical protein